MTTEIKTTTGFRKYDHLERLGHRNTRGIEEGTVYVFPKIDGTNASVWSDGKQVFAGSRKRQLSLDSDNAGFLAWLLSETPKAVAMRELALSCPNLVFYGEWLVPHTLKSYEPGAWRNFYVFDVFQRTENFRGYINYNEYATLLSISGVDSIEPIAIYSNPTGAQLKSEMDRNTYLIMEGQGIGEGVVVKNYEWRNEGSHDKVWGKFVSKEFSVKPEVTTGAIEIERIIAERFTTEVLVQKNLAKVLIEVGDSEPQADMMDREELLVTYQNKIIPQLLGRVWNDLIEEEMWSILCKHKGATINFGRLQSLVTVQIKTLVPELF